MSHNRIDTAAESAKTVVLKLTSAVAIAGMIVRAGELVEVTKLEAADLVQRGRAVRVASDDADALADDTGSDTDTDDDAAQDVASDAADVPADQSTAPPSDAPQSPKTGGKRGK